jgi:hypothetical protein
MPLRYQAEIDAFALDIACPQEVEPPTGLRVYRWSFSPIDHELNFLPNVIFDRLTNSPVNYATASKTTKCKRCGASFFIDKESAVNKWEHISIENRKNLGYTHLAVGTLENADGLMRKPDREGHFGFYEIEGVDLVSKFQIEDKLKIDEDIDVGY